MLMLNLPFVSNQKFIAASKCKRPRCEVCEYAKAHRKFTQGNKQQNNPTTNGTLKDGVLRPGSSVSVDQFECRVELTPLMIRRHLIDTLVDAYLLII